MPRSTAMSRPPKPVRYVKKPIGKRGTGQQRDRDPEYRRPRRAPPPSAPDCTGSSRRRRIAATLFTRSARVAGALLTRSAAPEPARAALSRAVRPRSGSRPRSPPRAPRPAPVSHTPRPGRAIRRWPDTSRSAPRRAPGTRLRCLRRPSEGSRPRSGIRRHDRVTPPSQSDQHRPRIVFVGGLCRTTGPRD